jgi:hypothetical protein
MDHSFEVLRELAAPTDAGSFRSRMIEDVMLANGLWPLPSILV